LGYNKPDNVLEVSFFPVTTMAKMGSGVIEIHVPNWYKVGTSKDYMYSNLASEMCKSTCMTIWLSRALFGTIRIKYRDMKKECFSGKEIVVRCSQFYNPIYQKKWKGFYVVTYDNESTNKPIERSVSSYLDASSYKHVKILPENMTIQPSNLEIATLSSWTVFLKVPIPMELGCYVKLYYPTDLTF